MALKIGGGGAGIALAVATSFAAGNAAAQEVPDAVSMSVILTAAEAALVSAADLNEQFEQGVASIKFTARYGARHWMMFGSVLLRDGASGELFYNGYRSGDDGSNWTVDFSGGGKVAGIPLEVAGKGEWIYNPELETHGEMYFRHTTKVGDDSWWWLTIGAEIVLGGAAGGAAGVASSAVLTPLGGMAVGLTTGVTAANEAVTFSETVRNTINTDDADNEEGPPPTPPELPALSELNQSRKIEDGETFIRVDNVEQSLEGIGPVASIRFSGIYSPGDKTFAIEILVE